VNTALSKLLYFSPISSGGLADYAHEQANALSLLGIAVTMLCPTDYKTSGNNLYQVVPVLQSVQAQRQATHKAIKTFQYINTVLFNHRQLADFIAAHHFKHVLLGSFAEYLAPLWWKPLYRLAQQGVILGAVVHDPVRDFVVGPHWWHQWSIACGYAFLREAFVHESIALDTGRPVPQLTTTVIPHGVYSFPVTPHSQAAVRSQYGLPANAKVLLSFGYIRDNKNLDLAIRALVQFPDCHLLVAGKEQSQGQRPIRFYQELAQQLGVSQRCHWQIRLIPETEIAELFAASDRVLLTYNHSFHSASGVLNTAVSYRKPCIASSGAGPLRSAVQQYHLGQWVEPDSLEKLIAGLQESLCTSPIPQWDKYLEENSWQVNAQSVIARFQQASL
jgi:glycosyltransferase involved in cell wall biosynthesis